MLFAATHPAEPGRAKSFPHARWLTWSPSFRAALARHRDAARRLRPALRALVPTQEYSRTFSISLAALGTRAINDLSPFAASLASWSPQSDVYFFTDLSCVAEGWSVRQLFATLRALIVRVTGNKWTALYTPLATLGATAGDFPLHCDLYVPEILFNVFDRVPKDESGSTILLPRSEFLRILAATKSVPQSVAARIRTLLTEPTTQDSYDEFFDLVHGSEHPWSQPLATSLAKKQRTIHLGRHEGYLLHDRQWLHGRTQPSGVVRRDRVHRLIYRAG
ncbi:MAG TPA: hypothetical protein VMU84_04805 [Thermoanaerobaculia bacterium]|nr:hypothetical protein [Thermoanaerobaculia bacterium]